MPTQKFKPEGKGLEWKRDGQISRPLSIRFPWEVLQILKSLPNTQDFVRAAVAEKLEREGIRPKSPLGENS